MSTIAASLDDPAAYPVDVHVAPQVGSEADGRVRDGVVLALHAAEFVREVLVTLLQDGIGKLGRIDREHAGRPQQPHEDQHGARHGRPPRGRREANSRSHTSRVIAPTWRYCTSPSESMKNVSGAPYTPKSIAVRPSWSTTITLYGSPSLVWSFGVSVLQPLLDTGRLRANVDFARAGYAVTAANYRRIVLAAMQEAEDGITGLAALDRASTQARVAIASTRRVLDLANSRYEGGVATYLDVITAQQSLLNNERLAAQLDGQRLLTTVFLFKALGGDWQGAATARAE